VAILDNEPEAFEISFAGAERQKGSQEMPSQQKRATVCDFNLNSCATKSRAADCSVIIKHEKKNMIIKKSVFWNRERKDKSTKRTKQTNNIILKHSI